MVFIDSVVLFKQQFTATEALSFFPSLIFFLLVCNSVTKGVKLQCYVKYSERVQ